MAIYLILDNEIHDIEKYEAYKAAVPAIVARHGGIASPGTASSTSWSATGRRAAS